MLSAYKPTGMNPDLKRIRAIANYQFGFGIGNALFPKDVSFERSKRTGKIRFIWIGKTLIATMRPTDGFLTFTIAGAKRLVSVVNSLGCTVIIQDDVAEVIAQGKNVMARHVVDAGGGIRPGDEVVVLNLKKEVQGVGRSLLTREEMLAFRTGVAVRTRRGRERDR
jgi:predicted RNA-binding protein (TIGR00451 family)